MGKYTTYVGLDVHARSIKASAIDVATGEVFGRRFVGAPLAHELEAWLRTLPQPLYCAYESGCTGFALARELRRLGFACDVIAVSTLPTSVKDRKQKCDKLDAEVIRSAIANPDHRYRAVWVPDERTEAERDLLRTYRTALDDVKRAKQRLEMFLVKRGHVWNEKTRSGRRKKTWTREYEAWLDGIRLAEPCAARAFEALRRRVRDAAAQLGELRGCVRELAHSPRYKPFVEAFRCLKGIDVETAALVRAEIGDFERFGSGRRLSCWLGTMPSDGSSGDSNRHGRITRAGNKYVRRTLIEAYSSVVTWGSGHKAPPKGAEVPEALRMLCARANQRLFERYDYLARTKHLNANKAKVAVVNELIRWLWVVGREVQRREAGAPCA